jgi:hypothetical protein
MLKITPSLTLKSTRKYLDSLSPVTKLHNTQICLSVPPLTTTPKLYLKFRVDIWKIFWNLSTNPTRSWMLKLLCLNVAGSLVLPVWIKRRENSNDPPQGTQQPCHSCLSTFFGLFLFVPLGIEFYWCHMLFSHLILTLNSWAKTIGIPT